MTHKRGGMRREGNTAKRIEGPAAVESDRMLENIARGVPNEFCTSCEALLTSGTGPCPGCGTLDPRS